jgi:nucleoid DNA-binding protein
MDLIKKVSAAVGITRKEAEMVMETILDTIVRTLPVRRSRSAVLAVSEPAQG